MLTRRATCLTAVTLLAPLALSACGSESAQQTMPTRAKARGIAAAPPASAAAGPADTLTIVNANPRRGYRVLSSGAAGFYPDGRLPEGDLSPGGSLTVPVRAGSGARDPAAAMRTGLFDLRVTDATTGEYSVVVVHVFSPAAAGGTPCARLQSILPAWKEGPAADVPVPGPPTNADGEYTWFRGGCAAAGSRAMTVTIQAPARGQVVAADAPPGRIAVSTVYLPFSLAVPDAGTGWAPGKGPSALAGAAVTLGAPAVALAEPSGQSGEFTLGITVPQTRQSGQVRVRVERTQGASDVEACASLRDPSGRWVIGEPVQFSRSHIAVGGCDDAAQVLVQ